LTSNFASIGQDTLSALVQRLWSRSSARVTQWAWETLSGGIGGGVGGTSIVRFAGLASDEGHTRPWSLILKCLSEQGETQPEDLFYWKREAEINRSSLLEQLPGGLAAPRCLGVVDISDTVCWLWLEDLGNDGNLRWDMARYSLAARHLGQFNGAYLVAPVLPDWPWLNNALSRKETVHAAAGIDKLRRVWRHPHVSPAFAGGSIDRLFDFWDARELLLRCLERLPQTFCHNDAFRRNLFTRDGPNGSTQTVAIDWAIAGTGPVGAELAAMVWATLAAQEVEPGDACLLGETVFDGYLAGLGDAGWHGDARLVRFGYAAATSLRRVCPLGYFMPLPDSIDEEFEIEPWRIEGNTMYAATTPFFEALGDEALALMHLV
jgi:hypothetical protein